MLATTKRWLRRRQTRANLAIGIGVLGAGYVAGQYLITKIGEARDRMIIDRATRENLRRRFKQNQEDCIITVLELLPTLTENVLRLLPCESITEELRQKKAERLGRASDKSEATQSELSVTAPSVADEDVKSLSSESYVRASQATASSSFDQEERQPRTKSRLWNELKINAITRAFTLIYGASLLTLLTRVQLNILGRSNYISTLVASTSLNAQNHLISLEDSDEGAQARQGDFEVNRQYLTFSWWLLHKGWMQIMSTVETAVTEVFGPIKPTEDVSVEQLSTLVIEVRKRVEGVDVEGRSMKSWLTYLLPARDEETQMLTDSGVASTSDEFNLGQNSFAASSKETTHSDGASCKASLRKLLDETADVIESPMFKDTLTHLLDSAFSHLVDDKIRSEAYKIPHLGQTGSKTDALSFPGHSTSSPVKLAVILAVVTREAHRVGNGISNEYLQTLERVPSLEAFAAVVYSSNFELSPDRDVTDSDDADALGDGKSISTSQGATNDDEPSLLDKAAGVFDAAWGGFESVWAKVSG